MKALVTGATGFIGSHLVEELIKRGCEVTCLVRKTSNLKWIEDLKANRIYGDCEDEGSLKQLPADLDIVFHLAGLTKARKDEDFFCVNGKGTENLLKAALGHLRGLKRFVYLSSLAAVGPSWNGSPVNEASEARPVSSYGRSKLAGEEAVAKYRGRIPATIIRPPAVYGPRDRDFYVLFRMLKKGFYPYWGKCYYSLLYVDDLIRGLIMAAEEKEAVGGMYFLSDGKVHSNEELVNEISNALGTRIVKMRMPKPIMTMLARLNDRLSRNVSIVSGDRINDLKYSNWTCDSAKAERDLKFIPKVTIKEGIKWTADWYRIHQWL